MIIKKVSEVGQVSTSSINIILSALRLSWFMKAHMKSIRSQVYVLRTRSHQERAVMSLMLTCWELAKTFDVLFSVESFIRESLSRFQTNFRHALYGHAHGVLDEVTNHFIELSNRVSVMAAQLLMKMNFWSRKIPKPAQIWWCLNGMTSVKFFAKFYWARLINNCSTSNQTEISVVFYQWNLRIELEFVAMREKFNDAAKVCIQFFWLSMIFSDVLWKWFKVAEFQWVPKSRLRRTYFVVFQISLQLYHLPYRPRKYLKHILKLQQILS